jgi:hypothetical protein
MRTLVIAAALVSFTSSATAIEIKGMSPGMDMSALDLTACQTVADVDSGMPGYSCNSTLGGEPARMRIAVYKNKVVAVMFAVENGQMGPTKAALTEKYGEPSQPNQFMQKFQWVNGSTFLQIEGKLLGRGYSITLLDFALFKLAQADAKEKVKKDL